MSVNTVINTNTMALSSHRALTNVGNSLAKASERLSTGLRINKAADDAAGLAISEKMRSQIRGLDQAARNAQDGISLIQTAEGALQETHEMLQRMRELVVQASSDALEQTDRDKIALELDELSKEINSTSEKTEYNKKKLIDGSWENQKLYIQVGANSLQGLEFNIAGMSANTLGVSISDIGDVVRGKYNTTIEGQSVGVDGVKGQYDDKTLNSLGIVSSTKQSYSPEVLGSGGKFVISENTLGTAASNEVSITAKANGSLDIKGTVTYVNEDGSTGTWKSTDLSLTKDDLAGKTFYNDDNSMSISFTADAAGKITATTTSYIESAENVEFTPATSEPVNVNGVDLTVKQTKSGNTTTTVVTSGSDLYDREGNLAVKAGGNLELGKTYYDANKKQLFSTDDVNPTPGTNGDITKITAYVERPSVPLDGLRSGDTYKLQISAGSTAGGYILEGNGSTISVGADSDKIYGKPSDGVLFGGEVNGVLVAGETYYDIDGNMLFTVDQNGTSIVEYTTAEIKLSTPVESKTISLGSLVTGSAGATFDVKITANGVEVADISTNTNGAATASAVLGPNNEQLKIGDQLVKGDYRDQKSGQIIFTVTEAADGTLSVSKASNLPQGKNFDTPFDPAATAGTTFNVGSVALSGIGGTSAVTIMGSMKTWDAVSSSFKDVTSSNPGQITLANDTIYYDTAGKALFKTNGSAQIETVYMDAVAYNPDTPLTEAILFDKASATLNPTLDFGAAGATAGDKIEFLNGSGVKLELAASGGIDVSGELYVKNTTTGELSVAYANGNIAVTAMSAGTDFYDSQGNKLFSTGSAGEINNIYVDAKISESARTTKVFIGSPGQTTPVSEDLLFSVQKNADGNVIGLTEYDSSNPGSGDADMYSISTQEYVKLSSNVKVIKDGSSVPAKLTVDDTGSIHAGKIVAGDPAKASGPQTAITAGTVLQNGMDYYDVDTGQKLFGVNNSGALVDYKKVADPDATTVANFYTPETNSPLTAYDDGVAAFCGGEKTTLEALADNKTVVTDELGGKKWTFGRIDTEGDPDFGKVYVDDKDGNRTIITIDVPVANVSNTALGGFADGLKTDGIAISKNGGMIATSEVEDTEGNKYDAGYNFATGKDHYGKTFETSDATISFDNDGKVSITAHNGHRVDTTGMNEEAIKAYNDFNTAMKEVQETGGSNGKIISLLTDRMDAAIEVVSSQRAQLGAYQNRLEHTIKSLEISSENLSSAESRIRDADMAKEMMNFTKSNILQSAAISMLAQANQMPQNILQLLR